MKLKRHVSSWLLSAMALILVAFMLLPVVYMLLSSFKSGTEITQNPLGLPASLDFGNYINALSKMNYLRSVLNSIGITLSVTVLVSFIGALAAYPLARRTNRLARALVLLMALGLSTPNFVTITPIYVIFRDIGLLDTYTGLILAFTALNLPLAVFFYTSSIRSIPIELEEAARLHNCSDFRIFWHVIRPLLGPATATLSLCCSVPTDGRQIRSTVQSPCGNFWASGLL